ncbi:TetR/AcrR family transcriptional regulator [Microbacterium sp. H1-D42]|uniref:TetR/AcrR family transcriptional regulator n=1 Tax=Microbacterium sp. H1-D42 TaxID=2925844 RepID=UPI001F537C55|nr:TetR/AcrR family transcriptional regulator [Microbacterium sp. H1-D42]UNK72228.1 TetR/AcrR family transcriptional regulator [Microbacterium sp. H1-D42]
MSPSTIYRYFDTKEDLVFYVLSEKMKEIAVEVRDQIQGVDDTREMMRRVFWGTLDYYDRNPGVAVTAFITIPLRSWMRSTSYTETARDVNDIIGHVYAHGMAHGDIDPAIRADDITDQYFMNCYRQIHTWHFHGMQKSLTSQVDRFFPLVWKVMSRCEPS